MQVETPDRIETDLRCDANPSRLFGKAIRDGSRPIIVTEGNLMEFSCPDCRRELRREGRRVQYVLHRFDVVGRLVETEVVEEP